MIVEFTSLIWKNLRKVYNLQKKIFCKVEQGFPQALLRRASVKKQSDKKRHRFLKKQEKTGFGLGKWSFIGEDR